MFYIYQNYERNYYYYGSIPDNQPLTLSNLLTQLYTGHTELVQYHLMVSDIVLSVLTNITQSLYCMVSLAISVSNIVRRRFNSTGESGKIHLQWQIRSRCPVKHNTIVTIYTAYLSLQHCQTTLHAIVITCNGVSE